MDVRVKLQRKLSAEELMLLNCAVGEDSWESLGLQGDPTRTYWRRSTWVFFGRNDAEAETPVLWPPHAKSWLIGKDPDAGRDCGQEEKGTTEDEMAGWHHRLNGRESEWTLGVGDGQGGLECCNSWGRKESDMTEWLNWTEQLTLSLKLSKHAMKCWSIFFPQPWNTFPLVNAYTHKLEPWIITGFIYMYFPTLIYDMVCLGLNCTSFSLQHADYFN